MVTKAIWSGALVSIALALEGVAEEADTSFVPKDGVIVSLSLLGFLPDDMKETYGFVPILGVRGNFDLAPNVSLMGGVNLGQKDGVFYSLYREPYPMRFDDGLKTRLRLAALELGLRFNSHPWGGRRVYGGGGIGLTWAGERFAEADGDIERKDHNGTAMGFHILAGGERLWGDTRSFGLEARLNFCSVRVGYERSGDWEPLRWDFYSIDLIGLSIGATLGFFSL